MKRILFLALALTTIGGMAMAQTATFTHQTGKDTVSGYAYTGSLDLHNKIVNISNNSVTVRWSVIAYSVANGWTLDGFCDNNTCYLAADIANGQPQITMPIAPMGNGDMKATFIATAASDNSMAYVTVAETDMASSYAKTNTFIAYKGTLGLTQMVRSSDPITIFPNPVSGNEVNVIYNPSLKVKTIGIYNLIGKLVAVYKTTDDSSAKLTDINKLTSGVYFLRFANAEGQVVATKKFTNQ